MIKKIEIYLLYFSLVVIFSGCTCHENKKLSQEELKEQLAHQIPETPDFSEDGSEYKQEQEVKEVVAQDISQQEKKTPPPTPKFSRKREKNPCLPEEEKPEKPMIDEKQNVVSEEKIEEEQEEDVVVENPIEKEPIAIAKIDVPKDTGKVVVSKSIPAETAFFQRWNGECLVYQMNWNFVKAGTALIALQETSNRYGDVYHLVAVTVPQGMLAKIGMGYYRIDAYIDKKTLLPYYYYQYSKNKAKEDILELYFNWKSNNYRWKFRKFKDGNLYATKTKVVQLTGTVYDGISSFYILRTLDFEKENRFIIPVALNEMWDLTINKKSRKKTNIPNFGFKDIYIVEHKAKNNAGFFIQGKMDMWITADKKRTPVYMEGKVPLGTGKLSLISEIQLAPDTKFNIDTISQILSQVR